MALARYQAFAQDAAGNTLASPSVEVRRESDNGLAALFSDRAGAVGISNPFTGDADGYFSFHVLGSAYKITVTQGANTRIFRYVGIGTASEFDSDAITSSGFLQVFIPATHDNAGIQAAVDLAAASGGGIVQLEDVDYTISAPVIISSDDIWLLGSANSRLLASPTATSIAGLIQVAGVSGTDTTLASNAAIGDLTITVTSAAAISIGDFIKIQVTQVTTGYVWIMLTRVINKVGAVLTLTDPMPFAMSTGDTSTSIRPMTLRKNVNIRSLHIFGNGNTGNPTRGILAQHMQYGELRDIYVDGFHNGAGIYFDQGYANTFADFKTYDCGDPSSDDCLIRAQTKMSGGNIVSESASGFGPQYQYCSWCTFGEAHSANSTGRGSKMSGTVFCTFNLLEGTNSGSTGVAITLGSSDNQISKVIAHTNRGGSGGNDVGLWFSDDDNNRNQIGEVIAKNNQTYDIYVGPTDLDNVFNKLTATTVQDDSAKLFYDANVGYVRIIRRAVNFNSVGDTAIPIILPAGYTRWRAASLHISHASGTLTTAQFGLFTSTGGGGTALIASGTVITVNTASENTNNNMQVNSTVNQNTQSFNNSTIYFRVTTAQGVAATGDVTFIYNPMS